MDYNAVLNRVRPMLTNGNHLSAQGFDALFGSCSQQEQEHLLAELAGLGILVDTLLKRYSQLRFIILLYHTQKALYSLFLWQGFLSLLLNSIPL